MARLTEQELDLIRLAKRDVEEEMADTQGLLHDSRRMQQDMVARIIAEGAHVALQMTGLALLGRLARVAVIDPVRRARTRRALVAELRRLDDHLLRDIGLDRCGVERFAEEVTRSWGDVPVSAELGRLRRWWRRQTTIRQLRALDDRTLADIGVARWDIEAAVDRAMGREQEVGTSVSSVGSLRRQLETAVRPLRQWNVSRRAAGEMARFGPGTLADLGYVKGDLDWVPEVLAERSLRRGTRAA